MSLWCWKGAALSAASGGTRRQRARKLRQRVIVTAAAVLAGLVASGAGGEPDAMTARAVGVPPAHWSEDFSFGIEFSRPVARLPPGAFYPNAAVIGTAPDNSAGTRWRVRVRAPWSADVRLVLPGAPRCVPGRTACGQGGDPLAEGFEVRIPARPGPETARCP